MKINKKFVNILSDAKRIEIGEIIKEMDFLTFNGNRIENVADNYDKLLNIFYTVDFLEKEGIIEVGNAFGPSPDMNILNFDSEDTHLANKMDHIHGLIEKYWKQEIEIKIGLYKFIDNSYKTDKQKDENRRFWLPIFIAILSVALTFFASMALNNYFADKNNTYIININGR